MKVAVMTDSTAYIPKEIRDKYDIYMVPLSVQFANASYQEEIDITTNEFYQKLTDIKELPKTSQPSIGYITSLLEEIAKDYDAVVSVHLSSGISGTYQAVVSAGEMVDGIDVYAYDSEISCMAQGFYVLEAVDMVRNGKLPDEIIQRFDEMKQTMRGYFMVDDLSNLHRGGRLNGAQAIVGSMLQVKPILHFVDKVIVPFEKIRTKKKALQRILDLLEADASEGHPLKVAFIHANNESAAIDLQQRFLEKHPDTDTSISYFGPVIGTHLGEGALGVTWYKK
ncbi:MULTISPECIES: DegV family protein [Clostridia]|uniref:DegV family protein n=1 Tax=Clostridia TaxID=186801 RepID=UPI000EA2F386|nr:MULTISPECIES: DegV family protein [Clostridia]NBJ69586.1 DegV family protein [Roseburia sp. 1XD42-34]RKI78353.1 DegV family protein [Clostridium sp. 1xD42-85]